MPRRVLVNLTAFGMAYMAVLAGLSMVVGLIMGTLMRQTPPATFIETPPVVRTATKPPPPPVATRTPGAVLVPTSTPSLPPTPRPAATLTSPPTVPVPSGGECSIVYVVEAGDTVLGIARRHGVTIDAIVRANNLETTASLKIGQQLVIPICATPTPAPPP